jgi:uncharacterized delta-60 repeat protein
MTQWSLGKRGDKPPMIGRRWVVRGAAATCALAAGLGVGIALAGSGGLDPSFGTAGTTVLERRVSTYPTPTRLAAGGKTVVVTTAEGVITVSRLLTNGAPDPTFDGDGKATIETAGFPSAHALAIQPDGKILLIGFTNMPGPSEDATVWRLNADGGSGAPNGALDSTFGTGARSSSPPSRTPSDSPSPSSRTGRSSRRGEGSTRPVQT